MEVSSPSSSTSKLSTSSTSIYTPTKELNDLLTLARDQSTTSDLIWRDVTEIGLDWIISIQPINNNNKSSININNKTVSIGNSNSSKNAKGKEKENDEIEDSNLIHFYCEKGLGCWEISVFLIRCLALRKVDEVEIWRNKFEKLISSCVDCASGFQRAKIEHRERYLSILRPEKAVDNFFAGIRKWEIKFILDALHEAGLASSISSEDDSFVPPSSINLSSVNIATVYHILVNNDCIQNQRIINILASALPIPSPLNLPRILSPGLIALALNSNSLLREFAVTQLDLCDIITAQQYREGGLGFVVDSILSTLIIRDRGDINQAVVESGSNLNNYVSEKRDFWKGLATLLNVLSPDVIRTFLMRPGELGIVNLVNRHLGDSGDHLEFVLAAFKVLLVAVGAHVWSDNGGQGYTETVLHSVLDNPTFESAFMKSSSSSPEQPYLDWLPPFLASVAHSSDLFPNSLAIVASTFLDRFQKSRFEPGPRTIALELALHIFDEVFLSTPKATETMGPIVQPWPHSQQASKVLDLHSLFLAQLAFSKEYSENDSFQKASNAALSFVGRFELRDSRNLVENIYALGKYGINLKEQEAGKALEIKLARKAVEAGKARPAVPPPPPPTPPTPLVIVQSLWDKSYDLVRDNDSRAITFILRSVAPSCHLEKITSKTWNTRSTARDQMAAINQAIDITRSRLVQLLMSFADSPTDALLGFIKLPGVVENITMLLLSPVEEIHNTAQGLVKQAYDVATRRDCFRSLIYDLPDATLKGLSSGIKAFIKSSKVLPEACGMAKRLVRCLSDVIDVLCGATDGLLRDASFLARANDSNFKIRLSQLWKYMTEALALLFQRTPDWSVYYENEVMTEWMRDAILFGEDMLGGVRSFEMAVSGQILVGSASPTKPSSAGSKMIVALNDPLQELVAWLRLNDEDLLSSSFNLIRTMLERFAKSSISIRPETILKIRKATDKSKSKDGTTSRPSILRDDQLRELVEALEIHTTDIDSEVEFSDSKKKSSATSKVMSKSKSTSSIEVIQIDDDESDEIPLAKKKKKSALNIAPVFRQPTTVPIKPNPKTNSHLPFGSLASSSKYPAHSSSSSKPISKGPNFSVAPMRNMARPRGVPWTTYSSKNAAESSSDSSDDDEGGPSKLTGLALLAEAQKVPKPKKTIAKRAVKMLDSTISSRTGDPRGFGITRKNPADEKAANSARLRGVQDCSGLHRRILQWDCELDTPLPPHMSNHPRHVPGSFRTGDDYLAAFEPLLLIECWEQIRQAKKESVTSSTPDSQPIACIIAGRQSVDDFYDIFLTVDHGNIPERVWMTASDIVLFRQGKLQVLAKVQSFARKPQFFEITLRLHLGSDATGVSEGLSARTQWEIVKLYSMSTIHREYSALRSMCYLELFQEILDPRLSPLIQPEARILERTMSAYQVNKPQAVAIMGSLKTQGFSLIQGPPGTGKTKTIVGLIGAFIDSRPRAFAPIEVGRPTDPSSIEPVAKVLLCAPSNAAVDEVAKRIKDGIRGINGQLYIPKVVRIGSDSSIDISVKDIFIDELVQRAISDKKESQGDESTGQLSMQNMRSEIDNLRRERDNKKLELDTIHDNQARSTELSTELKVVKSKIFALSQKLDSQKDKDQQSKRANDAMQRKVRMQILSEADVICGTLSASGAEFMSQLPFDFETVIIDEAAQSVELSSLIPLRYGCKRCILVGDPLQLPPTVISRAASQAGYEKSLFVRMMERGPNSVHLLSIQYRMHSHISAFPSAAFYNSRLTDGPGMDEKTAQPWHSNTLFPPYAFMHIKNGSEVAARNHSMTNPVEAATALAIYERLLREYPSLDFDYRIGIVTPYKGQVGELKRVFRNKFGQDILSKVSFNTVDGFQGQEKDIIILSCVRGGAAEKSIGFLSDTRRMNVALTRARSSLFVLGDSVKLRSNQYWSNLVGDAEARGLLMTVEPSTFRSLAPSAPPVIRSTPSVSANKSKASLIAIGPAAPLMTPKQMTSKAQTTSKTSTPSKIQIPSKVQTFSKPVLAPREAGGAGLKKRLADMMSTAPIAESSGSEVKRQKKDLGTLKRTSVSIPAKRPASPS